MRSLRLYPHVGGFYAFILQFHVDFSMKMNFIHKIARAVRALRPEIKRRKRLITKPGTEFLNRNQDLMRKFGLISVQMNCVWNRLVRV